MTDDTTWDFLNDELDQANSSDDETPAYQDSSSNGNPDSRSSANRATDTFRKKQSENMSDGGKNIRKKYGDEVDGDKYSSDRPVSRYSSSGDSFSALSTNLKSPININRESYNSGRTLSSSDDSSSTKSPDSKFKTWVNVSDPGLCNVNLNNKFTTYLVEGVSFRGIKFECRKRYSDFVWLRDILRRNLPGIPIPVVPQKQYVGRFNSGFVEERRKKLEQFLRQCMNSEYINDLNVFVQWLTRVGVNNEAMKDELNAIPIKTIYNEYIRNIKCLNLESLVPILRSNVTMVLTSLPAFRNELQAKVQTFKKFESDLTALAKLHQSQTEITNDMSEVFKNFIAVPRENNLVQKKNTRTSYESSRCSSSSVRESYFFNIWNFYTNAADGQREFTEKCLEVIESFEQLAIENNTTIQRLDKLDEDYRKIQSSDNESGVKSFFTRKNKSSSLQEISAEMNVLKERCHVYSKFEVAAADVLLYFLRKFSEEEVAASNNRENTFASRQLKFALQDVDVWRSVTT